MCTICLQIFIYTLESTEADEISGVPKDIISAAKNIQAAKNISKDELEIVFWDFGGQDIYYTTHQVSIEGFGGYCHFGGSKIKYETESYNALRTRKWQTFNI